MTLKGKFLAGAMTPREIAAGRYLRDDQGHPDAPTPAPSPTPSATPAPSPTPTAAQSVDAQYENEFGAAGPVDAEGDEEKEEDDTVEVPGSDDSETPSGAPEAEKAGDDEKEERIRLLEEQIADLRKEQQAPEPPKKEDEGEDSQERKAPDPADYEFGEADSKYISDLAQFHADKRFDERMAERDRQNEMKAEIEQLNSSWQQAIGADNIKETYPDFDEKVTKGADEKKWPCSVPMSVLIKSSEVGPHVAYELATNVDEAKRLAAIDNPQELLLAFGRLEGRVQAKQNASSETPPAKIASDAPPPPPNRARGGGGGNDQGANEQLYDKMLKEFK